MEFSVVHALLVAFYLFLAIWIIARWKFFRFDGISIRWVQAAFLLRFCGGIAIWMVYSFHYTYRDTSDAFRYYDDAMLIYATLPENPLLYLKFIFGIGLDDPELTSFMDHFRAWHSSYTYGIANDNPTVIRVNAIIALFSFGYYHVHTVFMAFFSMIGLTAIMKFFANVTANVSKWSFVLVFALPTVLFWGSGVLKEPILICGIGIFLFFLHKLGERKYWYAIPLILIFYFVLHIKPYAGIALFPGILLWVWLKWSATTYIWLKAIVIHAALFMIVLNAAPLFKAGNLLHIMQKKQQDFYNVAKEYDAGSVISIPRPESTLDLITQAPGAFFRTYFRPHIFESKSIFYLANALENLVLMALFVGVIFLFFRKGNSIAPEYMLGLSFVLILGVLIGEVVPVLGAVVRYKLPALPFISLMGVAGLVLLKDSIHLAKNNSGLKK